MPYFKIGLNFLPSVFGVSLISNILGIEGPKISASNKPTLHPTFFKAKAIFVAKVDFPTPPFALEIAIVYYVPGIGFFTKVLPPNFFFIASLNSGFSFGICSS